MKRLPPGMEEIEKETGILYEELVKVNKLRIKVNIYKNVVGHLARILSWE